MAAVAAVGVLVALGAGACGGSDRATSGATQNQAPAEIAAPDAAGGSAKGESGFGSDADQSAPEPGAAGDPQGGQQPSAFERKVVRAAQLSIEVDDLYGAAARAHEVGNRFGGYVADEKTDERHAWIQLKVESDDLDEAVEALAALGTKVTSRSQQADDVTEQYVDLESRITTQRASVERVRALLANASGIAEIVQVESELTQRQADLESLERRMAALSGQTELASVTVSMYRPGNAPSTEEEDAGFLAGLTAGWRVFLASTEVLLTVLGAVLPFLVALSIPIAVALWLVRRRRPTPTRVAAPAPTPTPGA